MPWLLPTWMKLVFPLIVFMCKLKKHHLVAWKPGMYDIKLDCDNGLEPLGSLSTSYFQKFKNKKKCVNNKQKLDSLLLLSNSAGL